MPITTLMRRRPLLAAAGVLAAPRALHAQATWPNRPITMIAPYPPGGTTDLSIRPIAEPLGRLLGQPIIVENRAGAGGTIGAAAVANARDGHTFLAFPVAVMTIAQHVMHLPFDPATAFVPVAMTSIAYNVIAAHPSVPFRDVAGLIAHAKANPGALRFGSAGNGTTTQLSGELFADATGIRLEHVPYRGSAPSFTDLLAGRVQLLFDSVAMPAIKDGRILGLATLAERRNPDMPDLPTIGELGHPDALAVLWFGVAAPAATPKPVVDRLAEAIGQALAMPVATTGMAPLGMAPSFESGETFAARITRERERYGALVRRLGVQPS
ncbi:Bug family tripartite tricarboxylate transporter substrate binding protein [Neoroseomonas soli]|uniref:Tripartite tricarboxylate transporter substrate binding protein n=1 Tax=Neoroseomonas soli TaxID=1081025 RepID=A0A9X9X1I4_9PROT|nr:tripartite tricarboxylate transporter substrate binding protein [Neoroseomonas soli]MBR0673263.1 tripartite tricarboxylate transporter substrate binding protein [Neoroseomonas soli]